MKAEVSQEAKIIAQQKKKISKENKCVLLETNNQNIADSRKTDSLLVRHKNSI